MFINFCKFLSVQPGINKQFEAFLSEQSDRSNQIKAFLSVHSDKSNQFKAFLRKQLGINKQFEAFLSSHLGINEQFIIFLNEQPDNLNRFEAFIKENTTCWFRFLIWQGHNVVFNSVFEDCCTYFLDKFDEIFGFSLSKLDTYLKDILLININIASEIDFKKNQLDYDNFLNDPTINEIYATIRNKDYVALTDEQYESLNYCFSRFLDVNSEKMCELYQYYRKILPQSINGEEVIKINTTFTDLRKNDDSVNYSIINRLLSSNNVPFSGGYVCLSNRLELKESQTKFLNLWTG